MFADLRTEVYDSGDRGLLGLALDPDFPDRPYVYALYTYDHVLGERRAGAATGASRTHRRRMPKPPNRGVDACPVSGRLVRLTADDRCDQAVGGEKVLVEDWCQQFSSHSIGDLQFGPEGALYASGGDGASFTDADYGQFGWPDEPVRRPAGGRRRAQSPPEPRAGPCALRTCARRTVRRPAGLDGTIIRIDPDTGEGLPGNPMFGSPDRERAPDRRLRLSQPVPLRDRPRRRTKSTSPTSAGTPTRRSTASPDLRAGVQLRLALLRGPGPNPSYRERELTLCEGLYEDPGAAAPPFFVYRHSQPVTPGRRMPKPKRGSALSAASPSTRAATSRPPTTARSSSRTRFAAASS